MASKYFENENLVIISSNDEIDMTKWRKYIFEKWNEVIISLLKFIEASKFLSRGTSSRTS